MMNGMVVALCKVCTFFVMHNGWLTAIGLILHSATTGTVVAGNELRRRKWHLPRHRARVEGRHNGICSRGGLAGNWWSPPVPSTPDPERKDERKL
jgi:hypothetical protein